MALLPGSSRAREVAPSKLQRPAAGSSQPSPWYSSRSSRRRSFRLTDGWHGGGAVDAGNVTDVSVKFGPLECRDLGLFPPAVTGKEKEGDIVLACLGEVLAKAVHNGGLCCFRIVERGDADVLELIGHVVLLQVFSHGLCVPDGTCKVADAAVVVDAD